MWQQEFTWFFSNFQREFRKSNPVAFEVIMVLARAHLFGIYNPQQRADFLGVSHQAFYTHLKTWSLYHLRAMLIRFMVKQAAEQLGTVLSKSNATRSRAALSLSIDNSVIDRLGKFLRCTWSWYSGRCKKVIQGQDLLGIVLTINQVALPVHLLFCSKQGRSQWMRGLLERRGWNRTAVAVANKNARIVWALLSRGGVYSESAG